MIRKMIKFALLALVGITGSRLILAHEHLAAGAQTKSPGSPLLFVNANDYSAETGYVFGLSAGNSGSSYDGYYYTGDLVFVALAATADFGGPEAQAAALGSHIEVVIETVEGPVGAKFGFWETATDEVDSTNLTWSVTVGLTNSTQPIVVSDTDGSVGADPYGHKHGRLFSVTQPGFYRLGCRFVDISTHGPGGGPIHTSSDRFHLNLQAGVTIAQLEIGAAGQKITFAGPSNLPDTGVAVATTYQLESTVILGPTSAWKPVGELVVGDDHLHTVLLPAGAETGYFRLRAQ